MISFTFENPRLSEWTSEFSLFVSVSKMNSKCRKSGDDVKYSKLRPQFVSVLKDAQVDAQGPRIGVER